MPERNPPGHRMAKPSNRLAKRLTSLRAGNLEDQRDVYRDDIFIDPNRYFRMSGNFGLNRENYENLARAAPRVLEGIQTVEQSNGTRKRTRGTAGPNPDAADTAAGHMMPVFSVQERTKPTPSKPEAKGKKRY